MIVFKNGERDIGEVQAYLEEGGWEPIGERCGEVQEWHLVQMWVNVAPTILKDIHHINFPFLTNLIVPDCQIHSLQQLPFLLTPNIEWINLSKNCITSIHPVVKCYWQNLRGFSFSSNYLAECGRLVEVWGPEMNCLDLEDWNCRDQSEDIRFFFKIQARILRLSYLEGRQRIMNKKLFRKLSDRYYQLDYYIREAI